MEKNTFVFYKAWMDAIEGLPDEVRLEIYEAIIRYGTSGILSDLKPMAKIALNFVKSRMDSDFERFIDTCEKRREYGRLGGLKKADNSRQNVAKASLAKKNVANVAKASLARQNVANVAKASLARQNVANVADIDIDYDIDIGSSDEEQKKKPTYVGKKEDAADAAALLEVREKRFYDSLVEYTAVYGAEMVRAFYDYWTEPNKSRTKMRFEQERTWDTARRLKAWAEREKEFIKNNNHGTDRKGNTAAERRVDAANLVARLIAENE